jgi:hypothetical protein
MGAVTQKVGARLIARMVALKAAVSLLLKRLKLEAQGAATGDKLNRLNGGSYINAAVVFLMSRFL